MSDQFGTVQTDATTHTASAANARLAVEFDYSALNEADEVSVRRRARAIRRRVDRRSVIRTAPHVVQVGLWLNAIRRCLGCHRFNDWYTEIFKWKQPRVSKLMQSARVFRGVKCLDRFDPTALYVLSPKRVPGSARSEAIDRARAGEQITLALAEAIVDRHRNLPEATAELRRAYRALRRARARLKFLGPAGAARLAIHVTKLRSCWGKLDTVLSGGDEPATNSGDPVCTDDALNIAGSETTEIIPAEFFFDPRKIHQIAKKDLRLEVSCYAVEQQALSECRRLCRI